MADIPRIGIPNAPQSTPRLAPVTVQQTPGGPGGGIAGAFSRAGQAFEQYQSEHERLQNQQDQFALAQAEDGAKADAASAVATAQQNALIAMDEAKKKVTTVDPDAARRIMQESVQPIFDQATQHLSAGAERFARARLTELQGSFFTHLMSWQDGNNEDLTLQQFKDASDKTQQNNAANPAMSEQNNATFKASLYATTMVPRAKLDALWSEHMQRSNFGIAATATEQHAGNMFSLLQASMDGKLPGDTVLNRAINALAPTEKVQLVNRAHDRMTRDNEMYRFNNQLAVDNAVALASSGQPVPAGAIPTPAMFARGHYGEPGGEARAALEYRQASQSVRAASIIATASSTDPTAVSRAIESLRPSDPKSPFFAIDFDIYSKTRDAVATQIAQRQEDPVAAARKSGRGGPAIQNAIDFTNPNIPALAGTIADRSMAAWQMPGQDPGAPKTLQKSEVPILVDRLVHMTPLEGVNFMGHVRAAMIARDPLGGAYRYQAFANEVSEHNPGLGTMGALAAADRTNFITGTSIFGAPPTMSGSQLAIYLASGVRAMNPQPGTNPVPKMDKTGEDSFAERFKNIAGNAYNGLPISNYTDDYHAALQIYYGMQIKDHPTETAKYNAANAESAIRAIVGVTFTPPGGGNQFVTTGYSGIVRAAPGLTESEARDALDVGWAKLRAANPRTAGKLSLSGVSLSNVPGVPGMYQVFRNNQPMGGDNRQPLIIDARRKVTGGTPMWQRALQGGLPSAAGSSMASPSFD